MLDSFRNGTTTVIGLLLIAFAVWTVFVWQTSQQKSYYQEQAKAVADASAHNADQRIQSACIHETSPALVAECVKQAIETSRSDQRAEYDLQAQREMSDWALGVLGLSLLTLGVSVLGIWYVRQTLMETRRIGQAEVRAYVTCEGATFEITPMGLRVKPNFHNTGNSPTSTIRIHATLLAGNTLSAIAQGRKLEYPADSPGTAPSLASGQKRNGHIFWHDEEAEDGYMNERGFVPFGVRATAFWTDVFGSVCEIDFTLYIEETNDETGDAFILYSGKMGATNKRFKSHDK